MISPNRDFPAISGHNYQLSNAIDLRSGMAPAGRWADRASCQRIDWIRHLSGQCASPPSPNDASSVCDRHRVGQPLNGLAPSGPLPYRPARNNA